MAHRIDAVEGAALRAGVRPGDELVSVDGRVILDFLDYQASSAVRRPLLGLRRDGRAFEARLSKGEYEPCGLSFDTPMMSGMRLCCNKCVFCFVDQLPKDARPTMRVKDDDWRMSLMMGNYVTLTNVSAREIGRIVSLHASPLYVSVHATDPELRSRVLGTPRAARLMDQLRALAAGGIRFHAQCVLCPGLNDGKALETTVRDLLSLGDACLSLALVPVGLTAHREGLAALSPYDRAGAAAVVDAANRWRDRLLAERGTRFVFPSDEFYLIAGRELPADEEYEEYGQIDDGVGMLRLLETEYSEAWRALPANRDPEGPPARITIACGKSAAPFLADMLAKMPIPGAEVTVRALQNGMFGDTVTVSGLLTGGDLLGQLRGEACDAVLITGTMLKSGEDRFLDDTELTDIRARLGVPLIPVGRRGDELLDAICETARSVRRARDGQ